MLNNNFFNIKRFAQLLKINWLFSSKLYIRVCLALFFSFILILLINSETHILEMDQKKILALNPKNTYAFVMMSSFAMAGTFSFRNLDGTMQINQHLMPVSVFERYLTAILEFFVILAVGTVCYLISTGLVQRIMELKYAEIVTKVDMSSIIGYFRFVLTDKYSVLLHFLIFPTIYFLSTAIRLSLGKNNPIKNIIIIAGIAFAILVVTFIIDFITSKIWGTNMAETMVFNNISIAGMWVVVLIILVLFSSLISGYYLLKRRPHA